MGFRDHFRSAKRADDRKASISSASTGATTPTHTTDNHSLKKTVTEKGDNSPAITLTKSHSRLAKTLTWNGHSSNKPSKEEKKLKEWAARDAVEWTSPMSHRPGRKDENCQNTLRAFDFRKAAFGSDGKKDRSMSACSGVSPSQSRAGSVDDGLTLGQMKEKRNSTDKRPGKLSQEITRDGQKDSGVEMGKMDGVKEE